MVLGLSVNTRMLGLAITTRHALVDYHISLRKDAWTSLKKERILASLEPWLTTYTITSVALAIPYDKQSTTHIEELLGSLTTYFKKQEIPICSYDPPTLYVFCEGDQAQTKKTVMQNLSDLYPELLRYYQKEMRNKNKYYMKLFEAVAVATIHARELLER